MHDCDVAIVGAGFGGSMLAMIARRLGHRVLLLERGRHPRFAIGESATPVAGVLIEQLARRYGLPRLASLSAYGSWQRACPQVGCGVNRGFTFLRHEQRRRYRTAADRGNQLLVAASPSEEMADTHWLRADVDAFLADEAIALGADYLDGVELDGIEWRSAGAQLSGRRGASSLRITAAFVVDATGPNGFLARALGLKNAGFGEYPRTQALFSHFTGVSRCAAIPEYGFDGGDAPPYPIDDAALHHVFDGGWMWVLRFGNGVTSAGVAVTDALAADLRLADGATAWQRLLARYPSIAAQFAGAEPIRGFTWMPRLPWRTFVGAGERWAMLPSAAALVDPLFSTGIPLTLLGVERLAAMLESGPDGPPLRSDGGSGGRTHPGAPDGAPPGLHEYSRVTLAEADHTARFVAGCYAAFPRFTDFTAYSMFYFAAARFAEMARRTGAQAASGFLGMDHPAFADAMRRLSPAARARGGGSDLSAEVRAAIEPLNIAGLCDAAKRNWYGVDPTDAIAGAAKLGVDEQTILNVLSTT